MKPKFGQDFEADGVCSRFETEVWSLLWRWNLVDISKLSQTCAGMNASLLTMELHVNFQPLLQDFVGVLGMRMTIWYIISLICNLWYCYNTLYLHTARSNPFLSICHKQAEKNEKQKLRFCKLHEARIWSRFWNWWSLLKIWDWSSILTLPGIHTCNIFERLWDHRWLQLPNSERKPSERSRFKGYLIWL